MPFYENRGPRLKQTIPASFTFSDFVSYESPFWSRSFPLSVMQSNNKLGWLKILLIVIDAG